MNNNSQPDSDKYKALTLQTRGQEAQKNLINSLVQSGLSSACYAYKSRVKPEAKLLEKKKRKTSDNPSYDLDDITDVVGLRLVTLFRSEMPDIVEKVIHLIINTNGAHTPPFIRKDPEEIIIYSTSYPKDEIAAKVREIVNRILPKKEGQVKIEHSSEGYSSIHIVARLNTVAEGVSRSHQELHIPVEIQIRTVFEDAWGEIDHKYGYVIRTGKDVGYPINNPEYVLPHLKVLKKFADACAQYADVIHKEATETQTDIGIGNVISVDADDELIDRLAQLQVQQELIDKYLKGRQLKESAASLRNSNWEKSTQEHMAAAEFFREFSQEIAESDQLSRDNYGTWLLNYYVQMNEAVCLLSTNNIDEAYAALNIYSSLEEIYVDFPFLKMRYGQALGKVGQTDKSILKLKEAKDMLQAFQGPNKHDWNDKIPKADFAHMTQSLPRLLGYQLWKKSTKTKSPAADKRQEASHLMRSAYEETYEATRIDNTDERELMLAHNNLLCYAVYYLQNHPSKEDTFAETLKNRIPEHLKHMEECIDVNNCSDIELLDSLANAYAFLKRNRDACTLANIILNLALHSSNLEGIGADKSTRLELAERAYDIQQQCCINSHQEKE